MPQGTSKGYSSARFIKTSYATESGDLEDSPEVHRMIQSSIRNQFRANGITFDQPVAQLIVTYMLIRQNNVSTTMNRDYFGVGRDAQEIMDVAHEQGVIKNKRPDQFDSAALVVDILDASNNELIYRHYVDGDVTQNTDTATRQIRINNAVAQVLEPFFRS